MALALTARAAGTSAEGHGTGSFTTTSFTPTADSLLVVAVYPDCAASGQNILGSLTINDSVGLTWGSPLVSVQDNSTSGTTSAAMAIWTAEVGSSPTSMTVTFDDGAIDVFCYSYSIVDLTGYDTGTPVGATGSQFEFVQAAADAWSWSLSGAPATTSIVFAAVGVSLNSGSAMAVTEGAGWSEIHDVVSSVPNLNIQSQQRSSSTSTTVAWVDTDAGASETTWTRIGAAVEVKESTGPAPTLVPRAVIVAG
jgi:hypothetical protein